MFRKVSGCVGEVWSGLEVVYMCTEGISTCPVVPFDMSKVPLSKNQKKDSSRGHFNMSKFPVRHVESPSASQTHFTKTDITWARKLNSRTVCCVGSLTQRAIFWYKIWPYFSGCEITILPLEFTNDCKTSHFKPLSYQNNTYNISKLCEPSSNNSFLI